MTDEVVEQTVACPSVSWYIEDSVDEPGVPTPDPELSHQCVGKNFPSPCEW